MEREVRWESEKDMYGVATVDNHIHLSGAFTSKQICTFIAKKLKTNPDEKVKGHVVFLSDILLPWLVCDTSIRSFWDNLWFLFF